jgi:hypothetical protein
LGGEGCKVNITDNSPAVLGATITFRAELDCGESQNTASNYKFSLRDNGIHPHYYEVCLVSCCGGYCCYNSQVFQSEGNGTVRTWDVAYSKQEGYIAGPYIVEVKVEKEFIIWYTIASNRKVFYITSIFSNPRFMIL